MGSILQIRLLASLDSLLHRLHVPHRFWWKLCDAYDISLGVADTPENFPHRHGFVRIEHVFTGTSSHPWAATCQRCGARMEELPRPCLLVRTVR